MFALHGETKFEKLLIVSYYYRNFIIFANVTVSVICIGKIWLYIREGFYQPYTSIRF